MPIVFNEPLSFLQRMTEYMEHTYLINRACLLSNSIERMQVSHLRTPNLGPIHYGNNLKKTKFICLKCRQTIETMENPQHFDDFWILWFEYNGIKLVEVT